MSGIGDHGHCEICQAVVERGERFCGAQCVAKNEVRVKELKKQRWMFIGIVLAVMLLFALMERGVV